MHRDGLVGLTVYGHTRELLICLSVFTAEGGDRPARVGVSRLARIIHKLRSEVPQVPVMARKTTEKTAGVFENTLRIGEGG
jgi:hypothetical protein